MPDAPDGRCYCGAARLRTSSAPVTVAYCHCRRLTGAPVAAFAAFRPGDVSFDPPLPDAFTLGNGVRRWHCGDCGSPLAAEFDYLEDQIYVPLGLFDHPESFAPQMHCQTGAQISWLHITDDLPRWPESARHALRPGP